MFRAPIAASFLVVAVLALAALVPPAVASPPRASGLAVAASCPAMDGDAGSSLPPGHPPVDGYRSALPPGHPPVYGSEPGLPPGHPPVDGWRASRLPPGHPPVDGAGARPLPRFDATTVVDL